MRHNSISTSLLQRRLGIGYPRAARLIDQLEEEEVVGLGEPGKSRKVLKRRSAKEEDSG
jgi:DNA segregation ATPase FtsK/SpoIIIE-like protein